MSNIQKLGLLLIGLGMVLIGVALLGTCALAIL